MTTRAMEFQDVRRLLGRPKNQCPSADDIISQLVRQEQLMLNQLNATGKSWTVDTTTVTSVDGTAEYAVADGATGIHGIGKPLFVYRDLGDGDILPVPMTDYSHELNNQSYEYWRVPPGTTETSFYRGEKVAFFRTADAAMMMRIYPVPEAAVEYTITYAAGELDRDEIALTDVPIMPEWSSVRTLQAALYLLPHTEWEGYGLQQNMDKQKVLGMSLAAQLADHRDEFKAYLQNPQHEPLADSGEWWER